MTEFEQKFSCIYYHLSNAEQAPANLHEAQEIIEDMQAPFLRSLNDLSLGQLKIYKDWVRSIAIRMQQLVDLGFIGWEIHSINDTLSQMCKSIGRALIHTQPQVEANCLCICKLNGLVVNCDSKWTNIFPMNPLGLNLLELITADDHLPSEVLSVADYVFEYYLPDVEFIKQQTLLKEDFIQMYKFNEYFFKLKSLVTKVQLQFSKQQGFQFYNEDLPTEGVTETYLVVQTFRIPIADHEYSEAHLESANFDELFRNKAPRQQALLESDSEYIE